MKTIIEAVVTLMFEVVLSTIAIWFGIGLAIFTLELIEKGADELFGWFRTKEEAKEDLAKQGLVLF